MKLLPLRYYAALKVRKFESLFYKIDTCLQKTTTCIGLQAEHIFSVNVSYMYFVNFGEWLLRFLFYVISRTWSFLWLKHFEINFAALHFYFYYSIVLLSSIISVWSQKLCLRFLKSSFRLEMWIFLFFAGSFLVDMFSIKTPSRTKKNISGEIWKILK